MNIILSSQGLTVVERDGLIGFSTADPPIPSSFRWMAPEDARTLSMVLAGPIVEAARQLQERRENWREIDERNRKGSRQKQAESVHYPLQMAALDNRLRGKTQFPKSPAVKEIEYAWHVRGPMKEHTTHD